MKMNFLFPKLKLITIFLSIFMGQAYASYEQVAQENFDQELNILVIGKSGAGKSSLLNTIVNLVLGKNARDNKEFIIKTSYDGIKYPCTVNRYRSRNAEAGTDQLQAQTLACSSYNCGVRQYAFRGQDGTVQRKNIKFTLFDTPGLADPRGIKADRENIKKIVDKVGSSTKLNAIAIVVPMGPPRLTPEMKYYIQEIRKMLPKQFKDNIVIVFTFANGSERGLIDGLVEMGLNTDNFVRFDNSALFAHTIPVSEEQDDDFSDDEFGYSDDYQSHLELRRCEEAWRLNKAQLVKLIKCSSEMEPILTSEMEELHRKRETLFRMMNDHLKDIRILHATKDQLNQAITDLVKIKLDIENGKNDLMIPTVKIKISQRPLPHGQKNTICKSCLNICHRGCGLGGIYVSTGDSRLNYCTAINSETGLCYDCGHQLAVHVHTTQESYTETFQEYIPVPENINRQNQREKLFKMIQKNENDYRNQIHNLEKNVIPQKYHALASLYDRIDEISMAPENDHLLDYLDQLESNLSNGTYTSSEAETIGEEIKRAREIYTVSQEEIRRAREIYSQR